MQAGIACFGRAIQADSSYAPAYYELGVSGMYASPEDWQKVNRFLLQKRICGQLLYMLDAGQLQALVRKLRAIGDKKPAMTSRPSVQVTPIYIFPDCGPTVVN